MQRYLLSRFLPLLLVLPFAAGIVVAQSLPVEASYEVGFSPGGSSLAVVMDGIRSARVSILVASYSFTSKPIASALLEAERRGVKVMVVADEKANRHYSAVTFLANQGVQVRLNGLYAIHHHKFMVIDGETLETGSFNYTESAVKRNAENVLLLRHVRPLAEVYIAEWQRLWNEATDLRPSY